ncbi:hypothetical protein GCM10009839_07590 [Catenulispora yoronensis]|uniref:Uncharacterized protein n=1 Tax=Catenulispora yoronensis TaxID=450799 RepID=A0ABN2TNM0_9ACTN
MVDGKTIQVTTAAEAAAALGDLDDSFLADLRYDGGVRDRADAGIELREPAATARLVRDGEWSRLVLAAVLRANPLQRQHPHQHLWPTIPRPVARPQQAVKAAGL